MMILKMFQNIKEVFITNNNNNDDDDEELYNFQSDDNDDDNEEEKIKEKEEMWIYCNSFTRNNKIILNIKNWC